MKFVYQYLKTYKKESILAPLFKMLEAIFELFVPLVVAAIIDVGIANHDLQYVLSRCGLLLVLAVIGLTVAITAQYFAAKAAINSACKMREDLFYHIQDFSNGAIDQVGEATLLTRITNDINQVQNGINMFLRLFLRSPFIVFGAMVMAFTVDAKVALLFVLVIPILGIIVYFVMRSTLPMFRKIQGTLDRVLGLVSENLEGIRVIRAFGNEEEQQEGFRQQTKELYERQIGAGKIQSLLNPATYVIVNLAVVGILWFAGGQVNRGVLTTGSVVALVNYMSQILVELIKLANLIVLLTRAFSSVTRIQEVMEMPADERRHEGATTKSLGREVLSLSDVSFAYPNTIEEVLSKVTLKMEAGETLGVIGGTGSGKSSLVHAICHDYDVASGQIRLVGEDVAGLTDERIARIIGVVPQKAQLFAGTIAENLRVGNENATDEELWEALEAACAKEVVEGKDGQLQAGVVKGGRNFSGGQRQRLTIARALVKKPWLLILDDSASALDLGTEARLRKNIRELSWHPATIIVSQRASSVREADQILVLENGEVAGLGTHQELMKDCEVYQEIYYSQFPREEAMA
ncbi:MAG: ABC transporter ATP-binding protein/permease [Lachnospiraceae bacterium]|nr:ABC transporter ATP-binding protein/permease [Lachnospiraceae bacterium]